MHIDNGRTNERVSSTLGRDKSSAVLLSGRRYGDYGVVFARESRGVGRMTGVQKTLFSPGRPLHTHGGRRDGEVCGMVVGAVGGGGARPSFQNGQTTATAAAATAGGNDGKSCGTGSVSERERKLDGKRLDRTEGDRARGRIGT